MNYEEEEPMPVIFNSKSIPARQNSERPQIVHYCRSKGEYCEFAEVVDPFLYCNHMAGPAGPLIQLSSKNALSNLNMGTNCPIQKNLVADYYRHLNDHPEEEVEPIPDKNIDERIDF